jgi:hypothetical protein
MLGTVVDATPALRKNDRARLALRFSVLEHPQTGSRVPIRTEVLTFAVDAGKKKKGAEGTAAFNLGPTRGWRRCVVIVARAFSSANSSRALERKEGEREQGEEVRSILRAHNVEPGDTE